MVSCIPRAPKVDVSEKRKKCCHKLVCSQKIQRLFSQSNSNENLINHHYTQHFTYSPNSLCIACNNILIIKALLTFSHFSLKSRHTYIKTLQFFHTENSYIIFPPNHSPQQFISFSFSTSSFNSLTLT
jgi:hypothetical protein